MAFDCVSGLCARSMVKLLYEKDGLMYFYVRLGRALFGVGAKDY